MKNWLKDKKYKIVKSIYKWSTRWMSKQGYIQDPNRIKPPAYSYEIVVDRHDIIHGLKDVDVRKACYNHLLSHVAKRVEYKSQQLPNLDVKVTAYIK